MLNELVNVLKSLNFIQPQKRIVLFKKEFNLVLMNIHKLCKYF